MLILEGPDGGGKTRLLERLLPMGFVQAPRMSDSVEGPKQGLAQLIEQDLKQTMDQLAFRIYDRHALVSEPIYGPICRGDCQWGPEFRYMWSWSMLLAKRPTIIFCIPPRQVVCQWVRGNPDQQMAGVYNRIEAIWHAYVATYAHCYHGSAQSWAKGPEIVRYDYTDPACEVLMENAIQRYRVRWNMQKQVPHIPDPEARIDT